MALADEIAKELRISPATVRNVLSGRNKEVWPSAKSRADQIREAAAKRRYRINTAARATATGRFNNIALVLSRDVMHVHIFPETLLAVRTASRETKLNIVLGDLPVEQDQTEHMPDFLRELSVDGILLSCLDSVVDNVYPWVRHYNIPAVWMNIKLPGDCVHPDDFGGGREATEQLLRLGHRAILYMDDAANEHYSRADRLAGYEAAMAKAGLKSRSLDIHTIPPGEMPSLLKSSDAPTAIVAYGWEYAVKVYCAALRAGIRVPEDLSIVSFHSWPLDITDIPISTMVIPAAEMGQCGFEQLVKKMDAPDYTFPPTALNFRFEKQSSVALPRK